MRFFSISHWLLFLSFLLAPIVHGQVISPFSTQFSANVAGNITMIGNTLETCNTSSSCTDAQNGIGSVVNNNDFQMRYIDVDTDPATFNSSRAALNLPAGASVLFAGLYWGGDLSSAPTAANNKIVKFQVPGSLTYTDIGPSLPSGLTCKELGRSGTSYSSFCDVTSLVQTAGNGGYTVANVQAGSGNSNLYAGWSMVVAYRYAGEPARNLTIFNGYGVVSGSNSVTIPISGFRAPPAGAVRAQIGVLAFEGDVGYTGDSLKLNGQFLTDALNPTTNFFNSNFTLLGNPYTARTPNYPNLMAVDANIIDTTNFILNNATSATLVAATNGDTYFPTVFTSAIEIYAPKIEAVKTTSTAPGATVSPDASIEYAITLKNTGQDAAAQVTLSDAIPTGTSFVAGSAEINGAPAGALATYDTPNNKIIFYLGTGAIAGTGGSLAINATTSVKFKVKVNTNVSDEQVIANTATINFKAAITDTALSASSNLVRDTVSRPVLVLSKQAAPNPVQVGANLSYTLNYRNDGTAAATNAQIVDTLPNDVSYVSNSLGASGAVAGQTVTLPLGNLPPGASGSVNIVVQVKPSVANATPLVNNATLSATGVTPVLATQTTTAISEPFLTLKKTASSSVVGAGRKIVYTLEFTNAGTSAATNVVLTDPIPTNTTFVAATGNATNTSPITWNLGNLAPGASGSVSLTVQVSSAATAATPPILNTATITGDNTNQAISSVSTPIVTTAALQLEKLASNSNPKPGELVTYTLNFSNIGSSDAKNVALFDPLLNYQSFVSASGGGVYDSTTNRVTWDLGTLTPQQSGSVTLVIKIANPVADGSFIKNTATLVSPGVTSVQADTRLVIFNRAKLSLKKSVSNASVLADSEFFFTLDYANTGSADSVNTYIDDPLPGNTTFVSATGGGTFDGSNVHWNLGTVPAGASGQVVLRLRTASAITNGTQIINSATINSTDVNIQPVSASASTLVNSAPILQIDKQGKEPVVAAGENQTYLISYANIGSDVATSVVITDAIPPNATFESATGNFTRSGTAPNEIVTWNIGSLAANTSGSVSLTVKFDTGLANGRRINNSASIKSDELPATTSTFITTISSAPVLKIGKVASANPAIPGQALNYTITISNVGNIAATKLVLEDQVPANYLENIQALDGGTFDVANNSAHWEIGTLNIGETRSFHITTQVKSPLDNGTLIENSTSLLSAELPPQSASVVTPVLSAPNLQISKTSDVKLVPAGGQITYSITYVNTGNAIASNTILEEALPANTTFVSATPSQTSVTGSTYQWAIGSLAPNAPATITFTVAVDNPLPNGTVINNTASINADNAQPVSASAQVTATSAPELVITKKTQGDVTSVAAGGTLTYVITVTNTGSDSANNTVIKDALPKVVTVLGPATPPATSSSVSNGITTLEWNFALLAAGATQTITIPVTVNSPLANGTILDNQAEVSADNAQPKSAANNVTVLSAPKLELTKTAMPTPSITLDPTQANNTISYTLAYTNTGTDDALNTTLVDYLPAEATYVSSSGGAYTLATHSVSWNLGTVAVGSSAQQTITVTVPSPLLNGLSLENNAQVTSLDAHGATTSTATAQALVTVESQAKLRVTKQVDQAQVAAGSHATYTVTISNDASATDAVRGWTLSDALPPNVSFVSASGAPLYDSATRTVTWQGGGIVPGAQQTLTLTVMVNAATPNNTAISNIATGSASNAPATPSAPAVFTVQNVPNLAIAKLAAASHVQAGQNAQYTINYSNTGTAGATNAVIVDALPANSDLTYVSAIPAPTSVTGQTLTWQLGTLAPGSNGTIVLTARVKSPLANGTAINNNATLAADSIAPIAANAGITVDSSAALSVTKQSSVTAVKTGDQVTYSITYKNQGTADAHDVYISDPLSADTTFVSATQSGTYNAANHTVTWPLGTVAANASSTVSVTVTIKNELPNGIVLQNVATLSSSDAGSAQGFANNTVSRAAPTASVAPIPVGSPWTLVLLGLAMLGLGLRCNSTAMCGSNSISKSKV